MVDKPMSVPVRKIGSVFGRLDAPTLLEVNRALALFLGIAG
jgi:mRNA interferase MazF